MTKQEELVDQLLQAPSLSSALYILYWNLTLDDVARRELGDLRLLINKEEARGLAEYENTLSPNCSRQCEIRKICVCGEVFTQRHYDYMAKEKKKLSEKQKPALYICDYCRLDYKGRDRDAPENVDLVCDSCNVNYFKEEEENE